MIIKIDKLTNNLQTVHLNLATPKYMTCASVLLAVPTLTPGPGPTHSLINSPVSLPRLQRIDTVPPFGTCIYSSLY